MGPVCKRRESCGIATQQILWIELGGKPKWLPLNFIYQHLIRMAPIYGIEIFNAQAL